MATERNIGKAQTYLDEVTSPNKLEGHAAMQWAIKVAYFLLCRYVDGQ